MESKSADPAGRVEEHTFNNWVIRFRSSHILPSQCTDECSREKEGCCFCRYTNELHMSHLPEMVFPNNILQLVHKAGITIEFNAFDALKMVKSENLNMKIACAEHWKKAREETGLVDRTIGEFDWTFQTEYGGTFKNCDLEDTDLTIDMNKLKEKEQILLYRNLTLFEDELHDNGIAVCSVRIRVMPSGFFILLRYFLRVDSVIILVKDSRLYHDFSTDFIVVEMSQRENKIAELQIPFSVMNEPDDVVPLLTLKETKCKKISL